MWQGSAFQKYYFFLIFLCAIHKTFGNRNGTVGMSCRTQADCYAGNYCNNSGNCSCSSTHTEVESYCWRKIQPGESGCMLDEQCSAAWPGAYCQQNVCKCPEKETLFKTRDGNICLGKSGNSCPLGGGESAKFRIDGKVQHCRSDSSCEEMGAYAYDCINPGADNLKSNSFCCPSKVITCVQLPLDEGVFGLDIKKRAELRWFYDSWTANCVRFKYKGEGGNANNFRTKEHCESYCATACQRGLPLYRKGRGGSRKQEPLVCNKGGYADDNYQCTPPRRSLTKMNSVQSPSDQQELYCPKPEFICSKNGGISSRIYKRSKIGEFPAEPFDVGVPDGSSKIHHRFYYDEVLERCVQFPYLGQGGNFNNFLTRRQCEEFCSRPLCSEGVPLKKLGNDGDILECFPTFQRGRFSMRRVPWGRQPSLNIHECPLTHKCEPLPNTPSANGNRIKGVCCPRPQFTCNLPLEKESCSNLKLFPTTRWWFNAKEGKCELFLDTSCGDLEKRGANRFLTQRHCQEYCRYAKVCPSPSIPLSDDGVAPYRFCNPLAADHDPIEGCGHIRGMHGHCQYSRNLRRHICCGLDFEDYKRPQATTPETSFSKKPVSVRPALVISSINVAKLAGNDDDAVLWKRVPSANCHSRAICRPSNQFQCALPLIWLLGMLALFVVVVAVCVTSRLRRRRRRSKKAIAIPEGKVEEKQWDEPKIACIFNPYSECPVEKRTAKNLSGIECVD